MASLLDRFRAFENPNPAARGSKSGACTALRFARRASAEARRAAREDIATRARSIGESSARVAAAAKRDYLRRLARSVSTDIFLPILLISEWTIGLEPALPAERAIGFLRTSRPIKRAVAPAPAWCTSVPARRRTQRRAPRPSASDAETRLEIGANPASVERAIRRAESTRLRLRAHHRSRPRQARSQRMRICDRTRSMRAS